jgi:1-acyl-sn-glycerol-3-phosphate acyltransferase
VVRYLIGAVRIVLLVAVLAAATALILVLALLPLRVRGAKLCAWPATWMARLFLAVFGVRLQIRDPKRLVRHGGFVFPNHVSFLDALLFFSLAPVRFLGKSEVRGWPLLGWIATAIDTVYVERASKDSRTQARAILRDVPRHPPIVLFPEGGIYPTGQLLNPFRWGAFEIAVHSQIPYLPCVILYDQRELVFWGDESLMAAVWRVASRKSGRIDAELIPLHVVHPAMEDDARQLAAEAHGAVESVLTYHLDADRVIQEGI